MAVGTRKLSPYFKLILSCFFSCVRFTATATSSRKQDIFNPFPPQFEKGGSKNFDAVVNVLNKVPAVDEMKKHCSSERKLIAYLRKYDGGDGTYTIPGFKNP